MHAVSRLSSFSSRHAACRSAFVTTCCRMIRTRAGTGAAAYNSIDVEASGQSPIPNSRPLPSAMQLSYVTEQYTSHGSSSSHTSGGDGKEEADSASEDTALCTEPGVWRAGTLKDAWAALHEEILSHSDTDPERAETLRSRDMVALGRYTAYAELLHLLSLFPPSLRVAVKANPLFSPNTVEEIYCHLGHNIEVRGGDWVFHLPPPSVADLRHLLRHVGNFGLDGRSCVANTAHRASAWRGKNGEVLGVTVRIGRFIPGAARALLPLASKGNLLILSKAGMGKTTLLRDLAVALAHSSAAAMPRVTIVDTSNEIGGDNALPLPFLGRCRRIQVPARHKLSEVMVEVIQNHSPEYLVVDEIATVEEARAAWSVSQRGVKLIATCHGEHLAGLLQNQALNLLVGGVAHAFLSNEERRLKQKTKKTVLERPQSSPFDTVAEITNRDEAFVYVDVNAAVDLVLEEFEVKKNNRIGGAVRLSDPLPYSLLRKSTLEREKSGGGGNNNSGDSGAREVVDGQGYHVRQDAQHGSRNNNNKHNNYRQGRGNSSSSSTPIRKRSDEELFRELSSLR